MKRFSCAAILAAAITLTALSTPSNAQVPPRLQIPGAVLLTQARPVPYRQQRLQQQQQQQEGPPPRLRRPPQPPIQAAPIRPVVEEEEEPAPQSTPSSLQSGSPFDDEVSRLGLTPILQSAVRGGASDEDSAPPPLRPVQFRPERPVPVLRDNIRDTPTQRPVEYREPRPSYREDGPARQARPVHRQQELRDEAPVPVRQPQPIRHAQVRQQIPAPQPTPQVFRQPPRQQQQSQRQQFDEEQEGRGHGRTRKPPVQILRKYRTDNPDGSITWGYENEDGSFKEETLGIDCVTRGKYGYVDPDGMKREYSYETGNKCDQPELEEEELALQGKQQQPQSRKPQFRPQPTQQYQQ